MEELRFDNQVAIVTGAGRGLGRAHALVLAARGARVIVNDLGCNIDGTGADVQPAGSVADEIVAAGGLAAADVHDISHSDGAESLVEATLRRFGRLDIVLNNAGILKLSEFPEADFDELDRHVAVHLLGAFNMCRAAWPQMKDQKYGRIVNTTSTAILGSADLISYGAAKGGIVGLSRALAHNGLKHGIAVNMISPMASTRMGKAGVSIATEESGDQPDRPPELVSAVVAFLAHHSCQVSGEIFVAGRGRVTRLFIGETVGYVNATLTPEDVRDNWSSIQDEVNHTVPTGTISHGLDFDRVVDAAEVSKGRSSRS